MAISVKGIQYSYNIDFHNQVATSLKSQVHDLPVLSAPEASPVDINKSNSQIVPDFESRKTFAGPTASPVETPESGVNAGPSPAAAFDAKVPPNSQQEPLFNHENGFSNQTQSLPEKDNTAQTIDNMPGFEINPSLRSVELSEKIPQADSQPLEPVKAMPKAQYNRAMRAYKPDYGSFLQATGYENPDQAGAVQNNSEGETLLESAAPLPSNPLSNRANAPDVFAPVNKENIAEPVEADFKDYALEENAARNAQQPENFVVRQARRIYEIISDSALVSSGNKIDVYF
ncbi:MAG: hypothetical protein ACQETH_03895 [Candidatus Rifleibacteriota bacterium]